MVSSSFKVSEREPVKYPKAVGFIISNEFCERFNYYGMRTILVLYLTSKLQYDDDTSTVLFHVFTMLVYLCPLVGAIVADSWLGKFRTILYLSIVYAIGGVIMALGAIPLLKLPVQAVTILGLVLIAIGTGGIKPCVSAFGGDQFRLPEQAKQLATFFSLFYFAINAGSMISTSVTPILREDVHCFGDNDCFSLAFGVPAILMLLSVVIFVAGKRLYIMKPPAGNMILGVSQCITKAIGGWHRERKSVPRKHWLDYAEPAVGKKMVSDTKILLKILVLFLPFPVFWALFDQQGSRWTFQATRMDGEVFGFFIKPDQMQVINPLLILGFIPLFDYVLYPLLSLVGIRRPLQKLTLGGLLAAGAFLLSAFVELKLEAVAPVMPGKMTSQLRVYNGMPCNYKFLSEFPMSNANNETFVPALDMWVEKEVKAPQLTAYRFDASSEDASCPGISGVFNVKPGKAVSYFIANDRMHEFIDSPEQPKLGNPLLRVMLNVPAGQSNFSIVDASGTMTELSSYNTSQALTVTRGVVVLNLNGAAVMNLTARAGGVYVLMANGNFKEGFNYKTHVVTEPNSVHMLWQLPQIIVITAAEIMFSITGLEFSFTQAPQSMKSVLQACWLLSVALGNMLVVVIAELKFFDSQAAEFALFAGLMIVDMFIFMLLAMRYEYVTHSEEEDPETGEKSEKANNGHLSQLPSNKENQSYKTSKESTTEKGEHDSSAPNGISNEAYDHNEETK
ncbi:peptide transporter family 1 isoform X2 [Stomoxys calcitrans]|uniref:peptide transporter family 1 isoform X2 n=1 Tax=Stomoxys calcitrans TaxID=35570 RepID=UPI0027E2580E|nr:peptide transporter family 1 isoform X2 [Stomoxys calcitrans]XP_013116651.2 peptide transporter family 1 isoform X2 [Stomoxys calcitrans]XP_013116652.2 peptide transporter family 1 isoform X2 [Stomoxys calcitrans]